jgi:hypothetical protein
MSYRNEERDEEGERREIESELENTLGIADEKKENKLSDIFDLGLWMQSLRQSYRLRLP